MSRRVGESPCRGCLSVPASLIVISPWVMENRHVDREYLDEDLHRLATDSGYRPSGWSAREISDFRVLVQCARAARFDSDLRNMRMLRVVADGTEPNRARATLSSGRVVDLMFKNDDSHGVVVFDLLTAEMDTQR